MRIAYVTHARLPSTAANAVQTIKMAAALGDAAHEVTLYSRPGDDVDVAGAFGVTPTFEHVQLAVGGPRGARTAAWLGRLRQAIRQQRPELVYSRDLFALCAVADLDVRLCFEAHWSPRDKPALRAALLALAARPGFVRIVAISSALRDEMLALLPGFTAEEIIVVPSAADDVSAAVAARGERGRLRVGYAGQLYAGKGAEMLAPIARALPDIDLHVVGGEAADVAKWSATAPANLVFHGHRPHAQVAAFLADVDVVLAPYQPSVTVSGGAEVARWMSPLKVFEYMAMSRAIVASDLPVLRECLDHEQTALLVPAADVTAWAAAIDRLRDDEGRARLGAAARARFLARHTWPQRAVGILADLPARPLRRTAAARALRSALGLAGGGR